MTGSAGGDPGDVKVRAAEGLEAVDYFFPGYHVWAKLIESLADLGYDANTMVSQDHVIPHEPVCQAHWVAG